MKPKIEATRKYLPRHGDGGESILVTFSDRETYPDTVELPDGPYDFDVAGTDEIQLFLHNNRES
jgi:hypothetical protein